MKKALFCGILASLFFAFTFLLNHSMNLSGGYWMWSACLRYLIMLPILALVLRRMPGERFRPVLDAIRARPAAWLVWSTVGFGFFYLPLTLASVFGESWLVAASWQVTIVAGVLLTPVFGKPIPVKNLLLPWSFWRASPFCSFPTSGETASRATAWPWCPSWWRPFPTPWATGR